ncbi:hypothetical protein [Alloprevotella tannerae]|uniref:hypothetical protein n=1 Tax=Alloprevotella tannerae TaxID=76122 RepID=UPI002618A826|nr:hypothetical protein [Alloprevotella tannerae]
MVHFENQFGQSYVSVDFLLFVGFSIYASLSFFSWFYRLLAQNDGLLASNDSLARPNNGLAAPNY